MAYTQSSFVTEVDAYYMSMGSYPTTWVLYVKDYIELLQDIHANTSFHALQGAAALAPLLCRGVLVRPTHMGTVVNSDQEILEAYRDARAQLHLLPETTLHIGPWTYMIPQTSTGIPHSSIAWSFPPPPYYSNLPVPTWSHKEIRFAEPEPECRCSNHAIATIGHEPGCGWMRWRNNNRKNEG